MLNLITTLALVSASTFDGITTVRFLKNKANHENDPLFGAHPSTARVFSEGLAIIAAEILAMNGVVHLNPIAGTVVAVALLIQSVAHVYYGIKNLKLPS